MITATLDIERSQVESTSARGTKEKIPHVVNNPLIQLLSATCRKATQDHIHTVIGDLLWLEE
jgi:hypothetical protein